MEPVNPREGRVKGKLSERRMIPSDLNLLIGIWLIISPFLLGYAAIVPAASWNTAIVGLLVAALAAWRIFANGGGWTSWCEIFLGIWLMCSPTFFHYATHTTATVNDMLCGLMVTVLAIVSAFAIQEARTYHDYLPLPGSRTGEFAATELSEEELRDRRTE